jgi:glutamate/tyrosine decarboxylase-like PLP-dependent enzyme
MHAAAHTSLRSGLHSVADYAADFADSLATRPAGSAVGSAALRRDLDQPCPEHGTPAEIVIQELVRGVAPGLVASGSPRYFGFVMSGTTPASLMADWLTSVWDQNAQVEATSPAAAAVEAIVARWVLELLGLPAQASVGLVTGGQMANFTALAAARQTVLERAGWDFDRQGLFGAPAAVVMMSESAHATVRSALRMLGFGGSQIHLIPCDSEGCMQLDTLQEEIRKASGLPLILSLQAGNVNTGAFEPIGPIADLVRTENAWIHVDGAFGLWAAASPQLRHLLQGVERADSWATDAHKWLNVPYDSGLVMVKSAAAHRRLKTERCSYAGEAGDDRRDGSTWAPENSRRARAFVLYAVLREFGREGIRDVVERCCERARQLAAGLRQLPGARVLNEVVLNQVIFDLGARPGQDSDAFHGAVAAKLQADGRCWIGTTRWQGRAVLRVSIANRSTMADDIAATLAAVRECSEWVAAI